MSYVLMVLVARKHTPTSLDSLRAHRWEYLREGTKHETVTEAQRIGTLGARAVVQRMPSAVTVFDSEGVPVLQYDPPAHFNLTAQLSDEDAICERLQRKAAMR